MKLQHPLWFRFVGATGAWTVRRLESTLDYHFRYADPLVNPEVARRTGRRYIYAFYHEVLLFPARPWAWPEMQVLISDHRDGELISQVIQRLGSRVIRGSSTRNGARALREMTARADQGHFCVTPDGPRGPRRRVQMGLAFLASKTGLPIVGVGMAFQKPWRAKSWDRFAVPRPFTPAAGVLARPLHVPPNAPRDVLEDARCEVERRLNEAMDDAEAWVERL